MTADLRYNENKPEAYWVQYIHKRIANNKNFLGLISGPTGSGKSWSGLSIGEQIDPNFNINRVIFKGKELMALINSGTLEKGSVLLWEEVGIELSNRNWQSTINKMLNYLLQTVRHRCYVLLFTTPYADFVDAATRKLFHAEFKTKSIDKVSRCVKIEPKTLQYNSDLGKFYRKYLRVCVDGTITPLIEWSVAEPSSNMIAEYEKKKSEFTSNLNKSIELALDKLEKTENPPVVVQNDGNIILKRALTPLQEQIYAKLSEGITNLAEIGRQLNRTTHEISVNVRSMGNKGLNVPVLLNKEYKALGNLPFLPVST